MERREFLMAGAAAAAASLMDPCSVFAGEGSIVELPKPDAGGMPLMDCLAKRRSNHAPGHGDVELRLLGGLLWSAWGVNSADGRRVVPTALNRQQAAVYAVRGDGVWEYLPARHAMKKVLEGDRRRSFDGSGLILLYAAPAKDPYSPMHVGAMFQNVGLFCASEGLGNCVKHQKHDALDTELPLPSGWKTFISHSIAPAGSR